MGRERLIPLEGCLNFRDLGGYPTADGHTVRWGRVFRSDALHLLTPGDVARLRDTIGLRAVIDLRSSGELRAEGRGPLESETMAFHHLPLFDGEVTRAETWAALETLADRYLLLAEFARGPIAQTIIAVADAAGPVVYHCAAGKDRTGVVSAIILGTLGVPDEVIVADYVATRANLDAIVDRLLSTKGYRKMLAALPPDTMHVEPETMAGFLARLAERHGSIAGYAESAGVSAPTLERLRARLLEG